MNRLSRNRGGHHERRRHCGEKISEALKNIPGVRDIKSKSPQKHVVVRYERRDELKGALDKAGFKAVDA